MTTRAQELAKLINVEFGKDTVRMGSDPYFNVEYLPTGIAPVDDLLQGGIPFGRFIEIFGDYCVTPDTKVLTDALSWAPAGEILPDYGLIGFDEELNQGRGKAARMIPSQVQHLGNKKLECVRIVTDKGEITCSIGHGFVAKGRSGGANEWRKARDIKVGDVLAWTTEPWEKLNTRDAGWAAGIIDGEGWIDGKRISAGQNPGVVLDEYCRVMKSLGFDLTLRRQSSQSNVIRASINGGQWEVLRALGQLRSVRMISRAQELWVGRTMSSKGPYTTAGRAIAKVVAVELVGKKDVVTMQTSSKTFIANGFPSHNSSLKSYVGLCAIRECQRAGKLAALIDTEHAYDAEWAAEIGVDVDDLIVRHPPTGEAAIDLAEVLIRGGVDFIVFDSVAAALPQSERDKKLEGNQVQPARLAQLMSLAMRKLTAANSKTAVLWINQTRINVGVMFGSNEAVPGGKALPFYASMRVAFRKAGRVTEDIEIYTIEGGKPKKKKVKQTVAQSIRATVEKSKLNKPFREVMFNFDFRHGCVDEWLYLATKALDNGVITLDRGNWWVTKIPSKKYRGEAKFREAVGQNQLRILLGYPPLELLGEIPLDSNKAGSQNGKSSRPRGRNSTRTVGQVGKKKMVVVRKKPTK